MPDYFVERTFAQTEFTRNIQASLFKNELCSELSFYSRYASTPSLPEKSVLFTKLENVFERSFNLKVKEVGKIELEGETFLYAIMPRRTMYRQNYIPCMLTTTTQIEQLLKPYRLSSTFNEMVEGLRERERMQAYVSDSVLEAVQDHAYPRLGAGKTIQATILFSDIRNFTGLTKQYSPEKIFELLNEFLDGVER